MAKGLLSDDHFTVDGTLIDAWASLKSFRPKGEKPHRSRLILDDPGNPTVDFRGEKRSNRTHRSTTDPESRLMRKGKGKEAKLSYCLNALMENSNGFWWISGSPPLPARLRGQTAIAMLGRACLDQSGLPLERTRVTTPGSLLTLCRLLKVTPHVARNTGRKGGSGDRRPDHPA